MSRPQPGDRRILAAAKANRDRAVSVLRSLSDEDLEHLHRAGSQRATADGYPAGGSTGGGGGPSILVEVEDGDHAERVSVTGTELAYFAGEKPIPDPVGRWIADLFASLEVMGKSASTVQGRLTLIRKRTEEVKLHPPGAGYCAICSRWCRGAEHDRIKSAYCPACYTAWTRAGRPDRLGYERRRREVLDGQQAR